MLSPDEIRARLPHGAIARTARALGLSDGTVHRVVNGTSRHGDARCALAWLMTPPADPVEVWGDAGDVPGTGHSGYVQHWRTLGERSWWLPVYVGVSVPVGAWTRWIGPAVARESWDVVTP